MPAIQSSFAILFLIAAFIAVTAGTLFFIRFQTKLTGWAGVFSMVMALELTCYYLMLNSATPHAMQFWYRVLIVIYLFLSIDWLFFVILFTGHGRWLNLRNIILVGAVPILLAGVFMLYLPRLDPVWMNTIGSVTGWIRSGGLPGYLFAFYLFGIDFISAGLLILMISNNHPYFRNLALFLCAGTLMVIMAGFLELGGSNPFAPVSIVQLFKIVHSIMAFVGVFIFRGGHVLPVARDAAFKHIQDGLLVLDRNDNLVDLNPAAVQILGQAEDAMIGKPITRIWEQGADLLTGQPDVSTIMGEYTLPINGLDQTFDVVISPVLDANREGIGRVVVLRNITHRERMEKTLQERTQELTRTNKLVTTLSRVAAHLGSATDAEHGFNVLSSEMQKLGLSCAVVTIDPLGEIATIVYASLKLKAIQKIEKLTGLSLKNYEIPKRYWPGDRILKEKNPIWYPNPREYIRRMFPALPTLVGNYAWNLLGIEPVGQICILPLLVDEKLIGAMPIWGADLQPADDPVLSLFASQVAGILQKTRQYEEERQLNLTLARSKAFTSALGTIAAAFSQRQDKERIFDILGTELAKLGLGYMIVRLSEDHQSASVENISTPFEILSAIQRFTGVNLKGYVIDRKYWGALAEEYFYRGRYLFSDNPIEFTSLVIPQISSGLLKKALEQSLGLTEQKAIYLPLINGEKAYGILGIWGVDLKEEDAPALSVFASQVASMLQNAVSFEYETKRANELARSNSIILALSKVASQLQSSSNSDVIFETVSTELKKMGLDSMVGILDADKQNMHIQYVSANQDVIRWAEKLVGHRVSELTIPRRLWPTQKVVDEKSTYWDSMKSTLNIFPAIPESLQRTVLKTAGINLNDPVCFLPIATEQEVIGVLSVWGADLKQSDVPALSILANQIAASIRNSDLFETEARRARELDILLKASDATSSSMDLDTVLLTLASQLLELSGFESCYISGWDREENLIYGRVEHSRILWVEEKRDAYSLNDYPQTKQVLMTGKSVILQGDLQSEERQWMEQLGRTAVMILPLYTEEEIIGLVEIAMSGDRKLFTTKSLQRCEEAIINAAPSVVEPLSANDVKNLFALEEKLLLISGGDICSISEWDKPRNRVVDYAVAADQILAMGQNHGIDPENEVAWKQALQDGKTSVWMHSEGNERIEVTGNGTVTIEVEALILFPLQKGDERIGLIELYDFNHKTQVSPEQLALLRAIADKAGFWIENARLLQQTQKRLEEQTELLHEKEVLLKEIHHRVKNNLQVISSLLNLQSSRVTDFQTIQALRDSRSRVRSMSLIHEKLYQSQSLAKIDFGEYIKSLASDLFRSYRQSFTGIQLNVQTDEVLLELDQAVPCGLILNELITNALKYAFPDGRNGTIMVELRASSEHNINLRVADDGVGISPDFDILKTKSLGLQLVNSLVAQLDGRLEMRNLQGTDFLISFPC